MAVEDWRSNIGDRGMAVEEWRSRIAGRGLAIEDWRSRIGDRGLPIEDYWTLRWHDYPETTAIVDSDAQRSVSPFGFENKEMRLNSM